MEIIVAKTAGFCYGVNNAVNLTFDLLKKNNGSIYTMGPIIHNDQVVGSLKSQGLKVIGDISEMSMPGTVVIRTHGVVPEVYGVLKERNLNVVDATCPYVKKIQRLVKEKYDEGYQIVIVGDRNHPEVKGINGWCNNTAFIVENIEDVDILPESDRMICAVAQTTITNEKWEKINIYLRNKFNNVIKFDTICNATIRRQKEALEISGSVDVMFVIGGANSSNTQKLFEICKEHCPDTYKIETSGDIPPIDMQKIKKIGITAGASTPEWVIKEVIGKMSEINKHDSEVSFKDAFEDSLVTLQTGDIVKGKIIGFNNSEIYVDMGYKSDGIIAMEEFSGDPDFKPEESLKIGEEIEVFVVRVNDGEGNVQLSKKKVDTIKSLDVIGEAYEKKTPMKAKVIEVINGGIIASANGVKIFVPASQVSDKFVKDLKEFLKQTINIRIIEYNKQKHRVIGSQRVLLEEEKVRAASVIWGKIEVNKKYSGVIKSLTGFGAFVDIGGVDGLIHISEISWSKIKHPSEVFKVGDRVEVTVLEFDKEHKRISLGFRKSEENPWNKIVEKYKVGDIVKGRVVRLVPFGAFVELEEGIDGLVHISQISYGRIGKPGDVLQIGQTVEAKITEANIESKKISLSIKEVNPIDKTSVKNDKIIETQNDENIPSEHKEDEPVTIGELISDSNKI